LNKQALTENLTNDLACFLAILTEKYPDLALVVERWPNLPENIKEAIKVLVKAYLGANGSSSSA
jgi:hypothetical protein